MKNLLLLLFFCACSFNVSSQVVTGVYKGKMEVDSPRYTVDFELTLKEKDGKLYGYCHRLFIVEDILYYNLVKVTARIADSMLIVEDEKSVSNNFKEKTSGVKTVMFFQIQKENDTVSVMPGEWSTTRTKKFLPITGKISVTREQNYLSTQLYKRLEDKKLDKEMAFEEKTTPQPVIAIAPPKTETKLGVQPAVVIPPVDTIQTIAGKAGNELKQHNTKPSEAINQPKQNLPTAPVVNPLLIIPAVDSTKYIAGKVGNETKVPNNQPSPSENKPTQKLPSAPVVNKPTVMPVKDSAQVVAANQNKPANIQTKPILSAPVEKPKPQPVVAAPPKQQPVIKTEIKPVVQKPSVPAVTQPSTVVVTDKPQVDITKVNQETKDAPSGKPVVAAPPPVINNPTITKRETEIIRAVEITEDSVVLSLYDNGEIDGDTVSVFVNNELVVSKVGLSAKAFKKTIYFKPGETMQLTFFAENLGSIPPNTGLLVIYTSTERHQIHFSSTFSKSSSILLRRKE
jgi:hypothetical protein